MKKEFIAPSLKVRNFNREVLLAESNASAAAADLNAEHFTVGDDNSVSISHVKTISL
jgi:hypothetical protein